MNRLLLSFAIFSLLGINVLAGNDSSAVFKLHGDTAFMKQDYIEAIVLYKKAIASDESNYLAYYGIARSLCALRDDGGDPCDIISAENFQMDLQHETIFSFIREAAYYSPETIRLMEKDTALECLHSSLEYHFHMGKLLNKPVDLQNLITKVNWRIDYDDQGQWIESDGNIVFTHDLKFKLELIDKQIVATGSYSISPYHIKMKFDKPFLDKTQIWALIQTDRFLISGISEFDIIIWNTNLECNP